MSMWLYVGDKSIQVVVHESSRLTITTATAVEEDNYLCLEG
jgi:hypothetical protein